MAKSVGYEVDIEYANLLYAQMIGHCSYSEISSYQKGRLFGSTVFSSLAFPGAMAEKATSVPTPGWSTKCQQLDRIYLAASDLCNYYSSKLADDTYSIVGCTTTFDQTLSSIAILRAIKMANDRVTTILGGGNCDGVMGHAIANLSEYVDIVFKGESELTFLEFLEKYSQGYIFRSRTVDGEACEDLDSLCTPSFTTYFEQVSSRLPTMPHSSISVSYEASRGCWWGQRSQCTFCGLNGSNINYRSKSADRVLSDLTTILSESPTSNVSMTDNIMPYEFHQSLMPSLATKQLEASIFLEVKAPISYRQTQALKAAGVDSIQIGIESLSSLHLQKLKKGTNSCHNVDALRYARMAGIHVFWNYLRGIPGELDEEYQSIAELVPYLAHLEPPTGIQPISIDRFSPYYRRPADYGLTNLRPLNGLYDLFPDGADVEDLAYHFEADYPHLDPDISAGIRALDKQIRHWRELWSEHNSEVPTLQVTTVSNQWFLIDSREVTHESVVEVSRSFAKLVLHGRNHSSNTRDVVNALKSGYLLELDKRMVPLALAEKDIYLELSKP